MQNNPILVENIRGNHVECVHRGAFALVDINGTLQWGMGDYQYKTYPRSALKVIQTLAALEAGIIEKFSLTKQEIAVLSASHNGEQAHVDVVKHIAQKAGIDTAYLHCGSTYPLTPTAINEAAIGQQAPSHLHHQCSGNHLCLLLFAKAKGYDLAPYYESTHPIQQSILGLLESLCNITIDADDEAMDGCSIPVWRIPLLNFAYAYGCIGSGEHMTATRAAHCDIIKKATWANPLMIAGQNRHCSYVAEHLAPHAFVKVGAQGVYAACFPQYGLGLTIKIDDGSAAAAEVVLNYIMDKVGVLDDAGITDKAALCTPKIINNQGYETGYWRTCF